MRYLTCLKLISNKSFRSKVTTQKFNVINLFGENPSYIFQKLVYLLSGKNFDFQHVSGPAVILYKRTNIHRKARTVGKPVIKHFRYICYCSSWAIQITKAFKGSQYEEICMFNGLWSKTRGVKITRWIIRHGWKNQN